MRKRTTPSIAVTLLVGLGVTAGPGANVDAQRADSPKGKWGRVTPIAEGNHPNLYYDRGEIEELRRMMLVQHSPQHLYDRYKAEIRGTVAVKTIPDNKRPHHTNMKAALSYAIEPTDAKATAIRAALLSYLDAFPGGLPGWYETPGCYFSGYSAPWMFDLLLAYHPDRLSTAEKARLAIARSPKPIRIAPSGRAELGVKKNAFQARIG